mgnify:CR=1 FL=1
MAIIYAGHGYYDAENCVSGIVLSDNTCLTQEYFLEFDNSLDSNHVFYFFDACYIGKMRVLGEEKPTRYVAMASDEYHSTVESPELGHGVFTYYFLIDGIIEGGLVYMEDAFNHAFWLCKENHNMFPIDADGDSSNNFALYEVDTGGGGGGG